MTNKGGEIGILLDLIDQAFDRKAWHGTNLRGSIRGLDAHRASWRPSPLRHNIWEIVLHAAYWKYAVRRRILGERRGSFGAKGSNWFRRPGGGSGNSWPGDVALLEETHERLRRAIAGMPRSRLHALQGRTNTNATLILGIAAHDLYHAGQIQLLKKLQSR